MDTDENTRQDETRPAKKTDLTTFETWCSGMIMGFVAYNLSFSIVPIVHTTTALIFGQQSLIFIIMGVLSFLAAGYLHTFASRTGMALSVKIYSGFYVAKPPMRARQQFEETPGQSLKRFFCTGLDNALVLNLMWQTFTIFYLIQTCIILIILENWIPANDFDYKLLLIHGITRYLAGCLSGISTGGINHAWQRLQKRAYPQNAIFASNENELKVHWNERRKLLRPGEVENWIKAATMVSGAIFFLLCNISNPTNFHLWPLRWKKLCSDLLVINFGWFVFRDAAMLLFTHGGEVRGDSLMANEAANVGDNSVPQSNDRVDV